MPVWVWFVYALAVARLTGLAVADDITKPARTWLVTHLPLRPVSVAVEELLTCAWCASCYLSAAVVAVAWHWGTRWWLLGPALALAFSQIAGMTSTLGRPTPAADDDGRAVAVGS